MVLEGSSRRQGGGAKSANGTPIRRAKGRQVGRVPNRNLEEAVAKVQRNRARIAGEQADAIAKLAVGSWQNALLAIDPGDKHVGMATFLDGKCTAAWETDPDLGIDAVRHAVDNQLVRTVVVENWRLYADLAAEQSGSEMLTSQMIGQIKLVIRLHNQAVDSIMDAQAADAVDVGQEPAGDLDALGLAYVDLALQPAAIKVPTKNVLRHLSIMPVAKKTAGDHARDAEIHGYHFCLLGQGKIRGAHK